MAVNPTMKPIPIELGGQERKLIFNLNTYAAFEEVTDKRFPDFLLSLMEDLQAGRGKPETFALKKISIKDFRAFLWAALHTYIVRDGKEVPEWPLSVYEIGSMLDFKDMGRIAIALVNGTTKNFPEEKPGKEVEAGKVNGATHPMIAPEEKSGGMTSGPSDAELLDSLTTKSED